MSSKEATDAKYKALVAKWKECAAGKFSEYGQLLDLAKLQDDWYKTSSSVLQLRHPESHEHVADLLFRSQQTELLRQVLDHCPEDEDPLRLLLINQAGHSVIAAVLQLTRGGLDPSMTPQQLWQRCLSCTAPDEAWEMQQAPAKEHWLPWWALQHPDHKVLALLLEGQDATLVFADGSNLLHEAVATAGADHLSALLAAVQGQMSPADMMAEQPLDRAFLDYIDGSGKTALYKLVAEYEELHKLDAKAMLEAQRKREAAAAASIKEKKQKGAEKVKERLRNKQQQQGKEQQSDSSSSSSSDWTDEEDGEGAPEKAAGTLERLKNAMFGVSEGLGAAAAAAVGRLGKSSSSGAAAGSSDDESSLLGSEDEDAQQQLGQAGSSSPSAAGASSSAAAAAIKPHPKLVKSKDDGKLSLSQIRAKQNRVKKMLLLLLQAGADPLTEVMLTAAEVAASTQQQLVATGAKAKDIALAREKQAREKVEEELKEQEQKERQLRDKLLNQKGTTKKKGANKRKSDVRAVFKQDKTGWGSAWDNVYNNVLSATTATKGMSSTGMQLAGRIASSALGFAGATRQFAKFIVGGATATALDRLILDPENRKRYTDAEVARMKERKLKKKEARMKKQMDPKQRALGEQNLVDLKAYGNVNIYNPIEEVPFEPDEVQTALLHAALRCKVIKARKFTNVVDELRAYMRERDKVKVAAYLEKLSYYDRDGFSGYPPPLVWRSAHESLLLSLVRCGTAAEDLQPHLKAGGAGHKGSGAAAGSTPGLTEPEPQRNALWVALAAGLDVFSLLLRSGRLQLEYTTGGNLLHALLQYNPGDEQRMAYLLAEVGRMDKHNRAKVLNLLHSSLQQTPLFMALATQQFGQMRVLLEAGADPLIPCHHIKHIWRAADPSAAADDTAASAADSADGPLLLPAPAEAGSSSPAVPAGPQGSWVAVPCRTTALHVVLNVSEGPDGQQHEAYAGLLEVLLQGAIGLERARGAIDLAEVLNEALNDEGASVLFSATKYALHRQQAAAAELLFAAGARATKPNQQGVSPLLLLLRWQSAGMAALDNPGFAALSRLYNEQLPRLWTKQNLLEVMPALAPADVYLLQHWLEHHAPLVLRPYLPDQDVHIAFIRDASNWPMAKLLLAHAQQQLAAAPRDSTEAGALSSLFAHFLAHGLVAKLDREVLSGMFALGLNVERLNPGTKQTILHAALEAKCSDAVVLLLVEQATLDVLKHADCRMNTPLHLAAALLDAAPERIGMVRAIMSRCLEAVETMRVFWAPNYLRKKPEEIPGSAEFKQEIERWRQTAFSKMRAAAGVEEEESEGPTAAANAADAASAAGVTGEYSQQRVEQLLHTLPACKPAAEEEHASKQAAVVDKNVQKLLKLLGDAAAGQPLAGPPLLVAEVQQLMLQGQSSGRRWKDRTWQVTLTRDALQQWSSLEPLLRKVVLARLSDLADGLWRLQQAGEQQQQQQGAIQFGATERQHLGSGQDKGADDAWLMLQQLSRVRAYTTTFLQIGSIVWEIAPDFSHKYGRYVDILRVWAITITPEERAAALSHITASYQRTEAVLDTKLLKPIASGADNEPRYFDVVQDMQADAAADAAANMPLAFAQPRPSQSDRQAAHESSSGGGEELVRFCPPASYNAREFTMLRLYDVTKKLISRVIHGMDINYEDFPFRLSLKEQQIVDLESRGQEPRQPLLVMGRSGTGKTTCIVQRVFRQWYEARQAARLNPDTASQPRQLFITASPTLKEQVARSFRKLQMAVLPPAEAAVVAAAAACEYHSLLCVPDEAFPLFLSNQQYLRMLDATVRNPMFKNRDPVSMAILDDAGGSEQLEMALDLEAAEADTHDGDGGEAAAGGVAGRSARRSIRGRRQHDTAAGPGGGAGSLHELNYALFEKLWHKMTTAEQRESLEPHLVFQEIMSYIKGSAEAVSSPDGVLSLEEYLALGAKRAANYNQVLRTLVYGVLQAYRTLKAQNGLYDRPDLVHQLYSQLSRDGYSGCTITHICRDEVQDFLQGELLLDLLVLGPAHAGNVFYCGDTAQTIARGVGFRFTDVKTMLIQQHKELAETLHVQVAEPQLHRLDVNYRSHAGILDVANAVVSVMQEYFPMSLDRMPRERAFFDGPRPLLLGEISAEEVAILTSGGKRRRKVEFGAHMCLLVRHASDKEKLPTAIKASNALIMEVISSKGLEFEDVLLVDFLSSMPDGRDWRVLLSYLTNELESHAAVQAEQEAAAALAAEGGGSSLLTSLAAATQTSRRRQLLEEVTLMQDEVKSLVPQVFNPEIHAGLGEELKLLYVAITRAKSNLIIFESDPFKRAALYYYLRRLGLATEVKVSLAYDDAGTLLQHTSNTPADWAERGVLMQQQQQWELAAKCFGQAGDWLREAAARAKALIDSAQAMRQQAAKQPLFEQAAVFLLEAAAGAAQRQAAAASGSSGGSAGGAAAKAGGGSAGAAAGGVVAPPVTVEEWREWLSVAAGVLGGPLKRWAEAVSIYCQLELFPAAQLKLQLLQDWAADFSLDAQELLSAAGLTGPASLTGPDHAEARQAADRLESHKALMQGSIQSVQTAMQAAKKALALAEAASKKKKQQQQLHPSKGAKGPGGSSLGLPVGAASALHKCCQTLVLVARKAEEESATAQQLIAAFSSSGGAGLAALAGSSSVAGVAAGGAAGGSSSSASLKQRREAAASAAAESADLLAEAKAAAEKAHRAELEAEQQVRLKAEQEEARRKQQQEEILKQQQQQQELLLKQQQEQELLFKQQQEQLTTLRQQQEQQQGQQQLAIFAQAAAAAAEELHVQVIEDVEEEDEEDEGSGEEVASSEASAEVTPPDDSLLRPLRRSGSFDELDGSAAGAAAALPSRYSGGGSSHADAQQDQLVCGRCGMIGHAQERCSQQQCSKCNKFWHQQHQCAEACSRCGALDHAIFSIFSTFSFSSSGSVGAAGKGSSSCGISWCRRCSRYGHVIGQCPFPPGFKRVESQRKGSPLRKRPSDNHQEQKQAAAAAATGQVQQGPPAGAAAAAAVSNAATQPQQEQKRAKLQPQQRIQPPKPLHELLAEQKKQREEADRQRRKQEEASQRQVMQQQASAQQLMQQQLLQQQQTVQQAATAGPGFGGAGGSGAAAGQQGQAANGLPAPFSIPFAIPVAIPVPLPAAAAGPQPAATLQASSSVGVPAAVQQQRQQPMLDQQRPASAPGGPAAAMPALNLSSSVLSRLPPHLQARYSPLSRPSSSGSTTAAEGAAAPVPAAPASAAAVEPKGPSLLPQLQVPVPVPVSLPPPVPASSSASTGPTAAPIALPQALVFGAVAPSDNSGSAATTAGSAPAAAGDAAADTAAAAAASPLMLLRRQVGELQRELAAERQRRVDAEAQAAAQQAELLALRRQLGEAQLTIQRMQQHGA